MQVPKILKDIKTLVAKSSINLDVLNAMALKIMILCNFRVGTAMNRDRYQTYGLTTLRPEHVQFSGNKAIIKFVGKKKQVNQCTLVDSKTVAMLKKLASHNKNRKTKSGHKYLFAWSGTHVTPESLNEFLGSYHEDITTKTWRTWFANIRFLNLLKELKVNSPDLDTKTKRKRASNTLIKQVASELHHTPAICKKNYLMVELQDLFVESPEKWSKVKNKSPDKLFMDFLKNHYNISKKWIRSRSRSRRVPGKSRNRGGQRYQDLDQEYEDNIRSLNLKVLDPKSMSLKSAPVGEKHYPQKGKGRSSSSYSTDDESYDSESYEYDSDSYEYED